MTVCDTLNEQVALIGKALSSPNRVQLLDLLCQGPRSVEQLAAAAEMQVANTSAHLQILRRCRLVDVQRVKQSIYYRLADDEVARFFVRFTGFAHARSAETQRALADFLGARDGMKPVGRDELLNLLLREEVVVVDVRPPEEYASGHIPGAISIPLAELPDRASELPPGKEIVAYCRGPYCVLAPQAVQLLRERGARARRLEDGLPEWRLAGLPVAIAATATDR